MIIDTLDQLWTDILTFSETFVIPDWGALVTMLPILLLIGVVGPILTLLGLLWLRYGLVRPRLRVAFADPRRAAALDEAGNPVFPTGEPYSPSEAVIYEPGKTRSPSGETLVVACPKCSLVRPAADETCGNCGLSFTLAPTTRSLRPAGPPPGGAAAA
ncbi:MAG TPA: hypothetical protein VES19_12915 [Candidatus Limnocylindrales bacterium]|nr:hypothetical protein [Candidatus Limnocylindrales bacterium]